MSFDDVVGLVVLLGFALVLVVLAAAWAVAQRMVYPPRKTYGVAVGRGLATEPAEMGLRADALRLTLSDGSETPAWLVDGERPGGPAVLVIHGYGDSRYGALTWLPLLVPHASKVLVYDLRGHGENGSPRAGGMATNVADAVRAMEALPEGRVVLFGYSMGGVIAIGAALAAGERVAGVVADGPYRRWDEPLGCYLRARRVPPQPILWLAGRMLRWRVAGAKAFDREKDAAALACPLLVLHGTADELCPVAAGEAVAAAAPRGRLVAIEGGGHLDLAAVDADRYRDALTRFFREIDDGTRQADRPHAAEGRSDGR